jgi:hypothetical protein
VITPDVEFTVINKEMDRYNPQHKIYNANSVAAFTLKNIEKNTRPLKEYSEVTIQIIGFFQSGELFTN